MPESIFDLLQPEEPQGRVKSAVRQISDTFAQALPRILEDPDEGFGAAFGAGFVGQLFQPDRESEAARAQQRQESLSFASSVFGELDAESRQGLLDELAPGLTFKSQPTSLTKEEQFLRGFASDLALNGKGVAQLQGFRALQEFGLTLPAEFEAALIEESQKESGNPLDLARRRALEIIDELEKTGKQPTVGQRAILSMAGAHVGGQDTLTPNQQRDAILLAEFKDAFGRLREGETPREGDDRILDKFLGSGSGRKLRPADAIDMIEVLDNQIFDAAKKGDAEKVTVLTDEIDRLREFIFSEIDTEVEEENPIIDPVQQAVIMDELWTADPSLVDTEKKMLARAKLDGFDDSPQLRKMITKHLKAKEEGRPSLGQRASNFFGGFNFNSSSADTTSQPSAPFVRPTTGNE